MAKVSILQSLQNKELKNYITKGSKQSFLEIQHSQWVLLEELADLNGISANLIIRNLVKLALDNKLFLDSFAGNNKNQDDSAQFLNLFGTNNKKDNCHKIGIVFPLRIANKLAEFKEKTGTPISTLVSTLLHNLETDKLQIDDEDLIELKM